MEEALLLPEHDPSEASTREAALSDALRSAAEIATRPGDVLVLTVSDSAAIDKRLLLKVQDRLTERAGHAVSVVVLEEGDRLDLVPNVRKLREMEGRIDGLGEAFRSEINGMADELVKNFTARLEEVIKKIPKRRRAKRKAKAAVSPGNLNG